MPVGRKIMLYVAGGLLVLIIAFIGLTLYQQHRDRQFQKILADVDREWRNQAKIDYEAAMADTYGGKTPQETLQMYIDAVEKGDFELASRYFVKEKQKEWEEELVQIANLKKTQDFLAPLRKALENPGEFSTDKKSFSIYSPVLVDFLLYPNGIWKLVKI